MSSPKKFLKKKLAKRVGIVVLCLGMFGLTVSFLMFAPGFLKSVNSSSLISGQLPSQSNVSNKDLDFLPKKEGYEIKSTNLSPPRFTANAVIAQDYETGTVLYEKNIHKRLLPASTTKIMSAIVGMDYFSLSDVLTVYKEAMVGGSVMGLNANEKISFRSLLYGMLLNSGNDAAFTIALNYPGGLKGFMEAMNKKASDLGLKDTHFQNPAGFDNPLQYSSAFDLAKIAYVATTNPTLSKVISTKETEVSSYEGSKEHSLKNLNKLLSDNRVLGIKTGFTEEAGENFVGLVSSNNHKVITVVLDSGDRFGETQKLMDWVYQNYSWTENLNG